MFKRLFISTLATIAAVVGLTTLTTPAAHADERPCVSRAEYLNMAYYWWPPATRAKVNDHFDFRGYTVRADGSYYYRDVWVDYRKCYEWGSGVVRVWFDNYSWGDGRMRIYAIKSSRYSAYHYM